MRKKAPVHLIWILLILSCFALPAYAASEKSLFQNAEKARKSFEKDKKARKLRHKWIKVIENYERVFKKYPKGKYTGKSLTEAGELYYGLYKISKRDSDLENALKYHKRVVREFSKSSRAARSQYRIGEIIYRRQNDPDRAYVELLKVELNHPSSKSDVAAARKLMAKISGSPSRATVSEPVRKDPKTPVKKNSKIMGLRHWHNKTYSRVAIDLNREVDFKDHLLRPNAKLNQPMRLYLDIEDAVIGPGVREEVPIRDGLLQRARVAQYDKETVRVVLDIQNIHNYRIFSLTDPFRIVVDVTGRMEKGAAGKKNNSVAAKKDKPLKDLRSTAMKRDKTPRGRVKNTPDQASLARQLGLDIKKVVIDPGHGGKDRGATGITGLKEKDLTLKVARILAAKIKKNLGLEVVLTRDKDVFLPLEERTAKANTHGADLFISIHANAHNSSKVNGIETYVLNIATDKEAMRVAARENATTSKRMSDLQIILGDLMLNSKIAESYRLGAKVHKATVSRVKRSYKDLHNLGLKKAPFYVLIGANMPSILIELGFISNKKEEARLKNKKYLDKLTDGIVDGIKAYKKSIKASS